MRESAGAGGGEAQHLKPVRQRAGMAALAAIFDIVMDRVVIARNGLERGEIGVSDGSARNVEPLADREILKEAAFGKAVLPPIETHAVGHVLAPASTHTTLHQEGRGVASTSQHRPAP